MRPKAGQMSNCESYLMHGVYRRGGGGGGGGGGGNNNITITVYCDCFVNSEELQIIVKTDT